MTFAQLGWCFTRCLNCLCDSWRKIHSWPQNINVAWSCLWTLKLIIIARDMLLFSNMNHYIGLSCCCFGNDSLLCRFSLTSTIRPPWTEIKQKGSFKAIRKRYLKQEPHLSHAFHYIYYLKKRNKRSSLEQ